MDLKLKYQIKKIIPGGFIRSEYSVISSGSITELVHTDSRAKKEATMCFARSCIEMNRMNTVDDNKRKKLQLMFQINNVRNLRINVNSFLSPSKDTIQLVQPLPQLDPHDVSGLSNYLIGAPPENECDIWR